MKREFLMKAKIFKNQDVGGYYLSEKLDGMRCFWDGGISTGIPKSQIPWANLDKDSRLQNVEIATGLWSQYGNVIHAPDYWLRNLPTVPMDGELWVGRAPGDRQKLMSIVKRLIPDYRWNTVRFQVFDVIPFEQLFISGQINNVNFHKVIDATACLSFVHEHNGMILKPMCFTDTVSYMHNNLSNRQNTTFRLHTHYQLPYNTKHAMEQLTTYHNEISAIGGEGLVLRKPTIIWCPIRNTLMLKLKKLDDAEGKIIGVITGLDKLAGMMGSLILEIIKGDNKDLKIGAQISISGFTDVERQLSTTEAQNWATQNQGVVLPAIFSVSSFKLGQTVTFQYRGLSRDGIPQEARYLRKES